MEHSSAPDNKLGNDNGSSVPGPESENCNDDRENSFVKSSKSRLSECHVDSSNSISADISDSLNKSEFGKMEVMGQFNQGFILTSLSRDSYRHIYIIDQHAADERYQLETLTRSCIIKSQRLLRPKIIDIGSDDAWFIEHNIEVLRREGFDLELFREEDGNCKMLLTSVPWISDQILDDRGSIGISKYCLYIDLFEIIGKIRENPNEMFPQSSKVCASLASNACRSAVMIGSPLSMNQMRLVLYSIKPLSIYNSHIDSETSE